MNQMTFAAFRTNLFSCSAVGKLQEMSQVTTQAENVDQMSDQDSSKVLNAGCTLGDQVTMEQLSNHEFKCTQDQRDFAGMLFEQKAEGELLQVDTSSQIFR